MINRHPDPIGRGTQEASIDYDEADDLMLSEDDGQMLNLIIQKKKLGQNYIRRPMGSWPLLEKRKMNYTKRRREL